MRANNFCGTKYSMLRFRCSDHLEAVDIFVTSLLNLTWQKHYKSKTMECFFCFICKQRCVSKRVLRFMLTRSRFFICFVLLSLFSHYEGKARPGRQWRLEAVSPDITSRCWLDSAEPEPWWRAWFSCLFLQVWCLMLIPPHVLLALSKHGRPGTALGRSSPHPPLQPTHSSYAWSIALLQAPDHLSMPVIVASHCILAVCHLQCTFKKPFDRL